MNQQERAILIWSVFFVMSGIVFIVAFLFSPLIGTMITAAYIMLYVGLSAVFMILFREMSVIKSDTVDVLMDRKEELEEIENALKSKYFKKKIDDASYKNMVQDYEKLITELEVKIKRLEKSS